MCFYWLFRYSCFFFNDTAPTGIYTYGHTRALHDALPISGAGIATSGAEAAAQAAEWPGLVATADHPLLSPRTIADFLARAGGADVAVGVVERAVVRSAFPQNKRTWLQ